MGMGSPSAVDAYSASQAVPFRNRALLIRCLYETVEHRRAEKAASNYQVGASSHRPLATRMACYYVTATS